MGISHLYSLPSVTVVSLLVFTPTFVIVNTVWLCDPPDEDEELDELDELDELLGVSPPPQEARNRGRINKARMLLLDFMVLSFLSPCLWMDHRFNRRMILVA